MDSQLFVHHLYTGSALLYNQLITIQNHKVINIENRDKNPGVREFKNLAPGLFDTHINGGEKLHFTKNPTEDTIQDIAKASKCTGTSYTLPTLITSSLENILKGIESTKHFISKNPNAGVLGMHLEGPYINPIKRGAHLAQFVRKPTFSELTEIIKYGKGVLKMITIAPEMFTPDLLSLLLETDITVSAGHSNATFEEANKGFKSGIRTITHMFNAMSSFHHREPGLVGAIFEQPQVFAPIILDGIHCDFGAAKIAYHIKGEKLFLISDALFLNEKVSKFQWEDFDATLVNGQYLNSEGNLAGGAVSLPKTIFNAVNHVGIPIREAIEMASLRPATMLGLAHQIGKIDIGYPAVFTSFNTELTDFEVIR